MPWILNVLFQIATIISKCSSCLTLSLLPIKEFKGNLVKDNVFQDKLHMLFEVTHYDRICSLNCCGGLESSMITWSTKRKEKDILMPDLENTASCFDKKTYVCMCSFIHVTV